jgi:hypothetical protein
LDRRYIEALLAVHRQAIRGSVLEVQDDTYTTTFGADRVSSSTVVDIDDANPLATFIADLCEPDSLSARRLRLHHPHPDPSSAPTPRAVRRQLLPGATTRRHAAGNGPLAQPREPDLLRCRLLAVHTGRTRRALRITLAGDVLDPGIRQSTHLYRLPPRPVVEEVPYAVLDQSDPRYPLTAAVSAHKPHA